MTRGKKADEEQRGWDRSRKGPKRGMGEEGDER